MPVLVLAARLLIQLSAMTWESSGGWPKSLEPCTHMGDLEEAPGSWFQVGAAPAIAAIWGVKQRMEDLSLSVSTSLCNSAFQINKNKSQKKERYLNQ